MENADELIKLKNTIDELREETSNQSKLITEAIITHINGKFDNLSERQTQIESTLIKHERRMDDIERQLRMRNIILHGVKETEKGYFELESIVKNVLKQITNLEIKFEDMDFVRRIGQKSSDKIRPIIVGLVAWRTKLLILKNKSQSDVKTMYITEDFPSKVLEKRKDLKMQQEQEQKAGNIAFIRYDKLIVKPPNLDSNTKKPNGLKRQPSSSPQQESEPSILPEPSSNKSSSQNTNRSNARSLSDRNRKLKKISHFFAGREDNLVVSDSELTVTKKSNKITDLFEKN